MMIPGLARYKRMDALKWISAFPMTWERKEREKEKYRDLLDKIYTTNDNGEHRFPYTILEFKSEADEVLFIIMESRE
jgi:hypothetical protein